MPIKSTYDTAICIMSYIIAGGVMNGIAGVAISWLGSLISLTTIAIIVFYVKKWLAKEDKKINPNGGLVSFIKLYLRKKYKDDCLKK